MDHSQVLKSKHTKELTQLAFARISRMENIEAYPSAFDGGGFKGETVTLDLHISPSAHRESTATFYFYWNRARQTTMRKSAILRRYDVGKAACLQNNYSVG